MFWADFRVCASACVPLAMGKSDLKISAMNLWNSSRPARLVQKDLCDILDTRKPYCEIDSVIFIAWNPGHFSTLYAAAARVLD